MVSYNTMAAMKKVSGAAFAASLSAPAALEVNISWQTASRRTEQLQHEASQGKKVFDEGIDEEEKINAQHHQFRYASMKNAMMKQGETMDYGVVGHIHTIEFRSDLPLIIGGVPLCSVFTPVHLGRYVPDGAQVYIDVLIENTVQTRATFIYSATAPTHVGITLNPQGTMEFSL